MVGKGEIQRDTCRDVEDRGLGLVDWPESDGLNGWLVGWTREASKTEYRTQEMAEVSGYQ